jgi:hypothetical protein
LRACCIESESRIRDWLNGGHFRIWMLFFSCGWFGSLGNTTVSVIGNSLQFVILSVIRLFSSLLLCI